MAGAAPPASSRPLPPHHHLHLHLHLHRRPRLLPRHLSLFLNSQVITEALLSLSSPLPAFRLSLLASSSPHLHSIHSVNRTVTLFLKYPDSLPHALDFIKQVKSNGRYYIASTAFEPLIAAYAKSGQDEKAVEVFERMLPDFGCQPNSRVYRILLKMFVEKRAVLLAMAVYNQMLKLNCRPCRSNYVIVMDGLCKAGMMEYASRLVDEMTQRGVDPTAYVYNILITAFYRHGNFDEATQLLHTMKEKGCGPREADYNAILSGLCKLGRVDDAFAQLAVFQDAGFILGLEGYSSLIDGLFRVGRFKEACWYFFKMLNENVKPDVVIYTIMIKGYADAGRIEDCFSLLKDMTDRGLVPDTFCYNTLIKALFDTGQLERARSLHLEISKNNMVPDSATYSIMLGGLCNAGKVDEAQKIFDEMSTLGIQPTICSYNSLVKGLFKAGEKDKAIELRLQLSQGTDRVRDSADLRIDKLCQSGQVLKAYKLLQGNLNSGVMPDIIIYNTVINGLCKIGDIDSAIKLFNEVQTKGPPPDEFTCCTLVDGLLRAHRDEDADNLFQDLVQNGFKPIASVCYQLMKSLGRKKRVTEAVMRWLDYLAQECPEGEAAKAIYDVRKHYEKGSLEEAVCGLLELDRVHGSVGPDPYTIWLTGFCLAGQVNDAITIYVLLREYGIDLTPASCSALIDHLCLINNLDCSVRLVLYSIKKRFVLLNKKGINRLIKRLCVQNKRSLAQVVISRLCIVGYNLEKYITQNTKNLLLKSE